MKELNDTDRAIIRILQAEGRATFAQIAQEVGLSPAAVHERVKKLEARGVITGYRASIDPALVGAGVTAFVFVSEVSGPRGDLAQAIGRMPWVEECHHIAGEESGLLKVRAESTRVLDDLIWQVRSLESVERTKTVIVLKSEFEGRPVVPMTAEEAGLEDAPGAGATVP
jgi:Lrp/AsnC family leucine-responsive transcriptional regulator